MLSLTVKKVDVFKFDGVAESDNTDDSEATHRSPHLSYTTEYR